MNRAIFPSQVFFYKKNTQTRKKVYIYVVHAVLEANNLRRPSNTLFCFLCLLLAAFRELFKLVMRLLIRALFLFSFEFFRKNFCFGSLCYWMIILRSHTKILTFTMMVRRLDGCFSLFVLRLLGAVLWNQSRSQMEGWLRNRGNETYCSITPKRNIKKATLWNKSKKYYQTFIKMDFYLKAVIRNRFVTRKSKEIDVTEEDREKWRSKTRNKQSKHLNGPVDVPSPTCINKLSGNILLGLTFLVYCFIFIIFPLLRRFTHRTWQFVRGGTIDCLKLALCSILLLCIRCYMFD